MNPSHFDSAMRAYQDRVEQALDQRLPAADAEPTRLHQAMRYACLGGGKRLRAILVYASGEAVGTPVSSLDAPACAVEMIHAYSLVHDDLPAMDNDALRRGKATCHRAFDEATAVLAGDALQALAFDLLASDDSPRTAPSTRAAMIRQLARAAGSDGMAGGQAIDLAAVGQTLSLDQLEAMHRRKTGALIRVAVRLGAMSGDTVSAATLDGLERYAADIGLAFQIVDDLLDETSDTATLGKTQGADRARDKPTYPSLLGQRGARDKAEALLTHALESLSDLGDNAQFLRALAGFIISRNH